MDLVIARLIYPNDVTRKLIPHQNYVYQVDGRFLKLYSVSSIPGKETRLSDSETKGNYEIISGDDMNSNGFLKPSFIDCSKEYRIAIDETVDLTNLSHREISTDLKSKIDNRIRSLYEGGKVQVYEVSLDDFKKWNSKVNRAE